MLYTTIKKSDDFGLIINRATFKVHNTSNVMFFKKTKSNGIRFGIAIPKKNFTAVERNKAKRQVRVLIASLDYQNNLNTCDIVFLAKKNFLAIPFSVKKIDFHKSILKGLQNI